ncbi:helix-turn-helix domain-containing protein [Microlunatus aurantiacus]|uniref:Helix-turn-helix domain-containing protein n=1 Tax=Microlunatus aurantiacus TaxID=446786 RepID=A0ABP7CWG4_9ACTN
MPLRSDWTTENCPIARSLEVLGDPWALLVLRQAFSGVRRFDHLRDQLAIADNVLSARLARLTAAGLLERVPYADGRRTRFEYVLTEAGADTLPVLTALAQWGERHRPHPDPAVRMDVVHRSCGEVTTTADVCSQCGGRLSTSTTAWRKSWRTPGLLALTGAPT